MKNSEYLSDDYPKKCECCEKLKSAEGAKPLVCRYKGEAESKICIRPLEEKTAKFLKSEKIHKKRLRVIKIF